MMISKKPLVYKNISAFEACVFQYYLYPLQAMNCSRNSRLGVDEDELKTKKMVLFLKQFQTP